MIVPFHKIHIFILIFSAVALALFGVIISLIVSSDSKTERSLVLSYEIDTQKLSKEEISEITEKYILPTLQDPCSEEKVLLSWKHTNKGIKVIARGKAQGIKFVKKADRLVRLQLPAFLKDMEILTRQRSSIKLRKLGRMLRQYKGDKDDTLPGSLDELRRYDSDNLLAWIYENVAYVGKGKSSGDLSIPIAYDKRLLEKGIGTNILFNDGFVKFVRLKELEKLGIVLTTAR